MLHFCDGGVADLVVGLEVLQLVEGLLGLEQGFGELRISGRFAKRCEVFVDGHFLAAFVDFDYAFEPWKFDFVSKIFSEVLEPVLFPGVLSRSFKVLPQVRHEILF